MKKIIVINNMKCEHCASKVERNTPDRLEQKKYCPRCKKTTLHKEKTKK